MTHKYGSPPSLDSQKPRTCFLADMHWLHFAIRNCSLIIIVFSSHIYICTLYYIILCMYLYIFIYTCFFHVPVAELYLFFPFAPKQPAFWGAFFLPANGGVEVCHGWGRSEEQSRSASDWPHWHGQCSLFSDGWHLGQKITKNHPSSQKKSKFESWGYSFNVAFDLYFHELWYL